MSTAYSWVNWILSDFTEFLVLHMLFFIESIFSEGACIWIYLVVSFAVQILKWIRARVALLSFQSWKVYFEVSLAASGKVIVVFYFMRTIISNIFWSLKSACKSHMPPLPTVLILGHVWAHVHFIYCYDITFYIKGSVNKYFG